MLQADTALFFSADFWLATYDGRDQNSLKLHKQHQQALDIFLRNTLEIFFWVLLNVKDYFSPWYQNQKTITPAEVRASHNPLQLSLPQAPHLLPFTSK